MRYALDDFDRDFPDGKACLGWLFHERFPSPGCPACKRVGRYYLRKGTSKYTCMCGKHSLSPKKGTAFQGSSTDLRKWFFAMFLMGASKNGVSAAELSRQLGVTGKCAWRMAKTLRGLMKEDVPAFTGIVEADETYMGARKAGKRTRGRGTKKTPVFGVVERGGKLVARVTADVKASTVMPIIASQVEAGARLMTDEYQIYDKAGERYAHETVQHGVHEYVRGDVHTNTIEGAWSHVKRGISGTHHSVSSKHLQSYVDFYAWQWNRRKDAEPLFLQLAARSARPS